MTSYKTTIQVDRNVAVMLQKMRLYPKQSYNELLKDMISVYALERKKALLLKN